MREATIVRSVRTIRLPQALVSVTLARTPASPVEMFAAEEVETARREGYQRGFEDASAVIETQFGQPPLMAAPRGCESESPSPPSPPRCRDVITSVSPPRSAVWLRR